MQEKFTEIQVVRQNPKILDNVPITSQGKKYKLSELATITIRGANLLVVTPFDEGMRDTINKGIESSKLDVQIVLEGNSLLVTLGNIPNDVKKELLATITKIYNNIKDSIKDNRHSFLGEMKKLEKILGKDDVKRLERNVLDQVEK
jgi:ribosome recycling factor